MHSTIVVLLVALAGSAIANPVTFANGNGKEYQRGTPGFDYDCSGKVDGDYNHPTKCDYFVSCVAETHAYEMPCALNLDGVNRLHFVQNSGPNTNTSRCDYPEVAGCNAATPDPPATTAQPPVDENSCDPELCRLRGYCTEFEVCNPDTRQWEARSCDEDLFWNNAADDGQVHGGNCDFFQNLSSEDQEALKNDHECVPPCAWLQSDDQACTGRYTYRAPFDNVTLQGRESELSCPQNSDGVQLIWVQSDLTCRNLESATNLKGEPCQSA